MATASPRPLPPISLPTLTGWSLWRWVAADTAIAGNLLFEMLSIPAKQAIIRSMTPQPVRAGDVIIKQASRQLMPRRTLSRTCVTL